MVCDNCKNEIQEKIKKYRYYVGTSHGANEFFELDKEGQTDLDIMEGTSRVFMYLFAEYL